MLGVTPRSRSADNSPPSDERLSPSTAKLGRNVNVASVGTCCASASFAGSGADTTTRPSTFPVSVPDELPPGAALPEEVSVEPTHLAAPRFSTVRSPNAVDPLLPRTNLTALAGLLVLWSPPT